MSEQSDPIYDQIHDRLQEKDTGELLEIWKKNNRDEWSDTAFSIIHDILLDRLGSEPPPQGAPFEEEAEEETFLDIDKIASLSAISNAIAWVVLVGYAIAWVANLLLGFSGSIPLSQIFALLPLLLQGLFLFVVLRFVSEALYLLLEIVENTRP
jgi:hypothetical protein